MAIAELPLVERKSRRREFVKPSEVTVKQMSKRAMQQARGRRRRNPIALNGDHRSITSRAGLVASDYSGFLYRDENGDFYVKRR